MDEDEEKNPNIDVNDEFRFSSITCFAVVVVVSLLLVVDNAICLFWLCLLLIYASRWGSTSNLSRSRTCSFLQHGQA